MSPEILGSVIQQRGKRVKKLVLGIVLDAKNSWCYAVAAEVQMSLAIADNAYG